MSQPSARVDTPASTSTAGGAAARAGEDGSPPDAREVLPCVAALATALDLANGLAEDKSMLAAAFAAELAFEAGQPSAVAADAFLAALLRHLGCTAFAPTESAFAQDDIALRRSLMMPGINAAAAVLRANPRWLARASALVTLMRQAAGLRADWTQQACEAARMLAADLGCGSAVITALGEVYEQWDGSGAPQGKAGESISPAARIAQAAHVAVLVWLAEGARGAGAQLRSQAGRSLEPRLAALAATLLPRLDEPDFFDSLLARLGEAVALPTPLEVVATTFGDFADLQSPYTTGHSRAVRELADAIAVQLGLGDAAAADLGLAASLHDLGQVALPTALWLQARPWRKAERSAAAAHAFHTERILAAAPRLAAAARIAGQHHEPSRAGPNVWPDDAGLPAAILRAADMACGMRERRPHRAAHRLDAVVECLRSSMRPGTSDGRVIDAAVACLGLPAGRARPQRSMLSAREHEVLLRLALGETNKQIARALGISDRTVQTHTLRIYEKLEVGTRAGATLAAARLGLFAGAEGGSASWRMARR